MTKLLKFGLNMWLVRSGTFLLSELSLWMLHIQYLYVKNIHVA